MCVCVCVYIYIYIYILCLLSLPPLPHHTILGHDRGPRWAHCDIAASH